MEASAIATTAVSSVFFIELLGICFLGEVVESIVLGEQRVA